MEAFATKKLPERYDAIAPDGSEVRILARVDRGSAAHFQLDAGYVAQAVMHRTIDEIWYFLSGDGEFWRRERRWRRSDRQRRPRRLHHHSSAHAVSVQGDRKRAAEGVRRHHAAMAGVRGGEVEPVTGTWTAKLPPR